MKRMERPRSTNGPRHLVKTLSSVSKSTLLVIRAPHDTRENVTTVTLPKCHKRDESNVHPAEQTEGLCATENYTEGKKMKTATIQSQPGSTQR